MTSCYLVMHLFYKLMNQICVAHMLLLECSQPARGSVPLEVTECPSWRHPCAAAPQQRWEPLCLWPRPCWDADWLDHGQFLCRQPQLLWPHLKTLFPLQSPLTPCSFCYFFPWWRLSPGKVGCNNLDVPFASKHSVDSSLYFEQL